MGEVVSVRRYYLLKRFKNRLLCFEEDPWAAKQIAEPGTDLPATLPHRAALISAGYLATEDLDGADAPELVAQAGLKTREAEAVLTALAAL